MADKRNGQHGREEALSSQSVSPSRCGSVPCGLRPTPTPAPKTVPVTVKAVETIEPEQPTGNTVFLFGKVIDSETREEIPFAQVTIESNRGKMRFDSPFTFSFPTMTVITLTTTAPGYQPRQEVMKPHHKRNVTLTIDIPLAPVPTEKD